MSKKEIQDLERLARFLDSKYRLLGIPVGWDAILGLVPGIGGLVTFGMSAYIFLRAAALGVTSAVLVRMGLNVLIDSFFSSIPVLGNIADVFFRANNKNMVLLKHALTDPKGADRSSKAVVAFLFLILLALLMAVVWLGVELAQYLYGLIFSAQSDWH